MSIPSKGSKISIGKSRSFKSTSDPRATITSSATRVDGEDALSIVESKHSEIIIQYGGCEGPNSQYLKLVSSDNHEFIIERRYAEVSGRIKRTIRNTRRQIADDEPNELHFPGTPSHIMRKVCEYFLFKVYYTYSTGEIPEFPIPFEIALQLLMSANYFDC